MYNRKLCLPLTGTPSGGRNHKYGVREDWLGSHRVPLFHTHLMSGCEALENVYFASYAFH